MIFGIDKAIIVATLKWLPVPLGVSLVFSALSYWHPTAGLFLQLSSVGVQSVLWFGPLDAVVEEEIKKSRSDSIHQ